MDDGISERINFIKCNAEKLKIPKNLEIEEQLIGPTIELIFIAE